MQVDSVNNNDSTYLAYVYVHVSKVQNGSTLNSTPPHLPAQISVSHPKGLLLGLRLAKFTSHI